jgi:hypothetical protein
VPYSAKSQELKIPRTDPTRGMATSQAFDSHLESSEVDPQHSAENAMGRDRHTFAQAQRAVRQ